MYIYVCISRFPPLWSLCHGFTQVIVPESIGPTWDYLLTCQRKAVGRRCRGREKLNRQHSIPSTIYSCYKNDIMSLYSLYSLYKLCRGHVFRSLLNSLNPTYVFNMDAEMVDAHTAISRVGWKWLGGWVLLLKDMNFIEYAINEVRSWAERDSKNEAFCISAGPIRGKINN